jgi:hypothetical protein
VIILFNRNKVNQKINFRNKFGNYGSSFSSEGIINKKDLYDYLLECSQKFANGKIIIYFLDGELYITDEGTKKSDRVEEKLDNITNIIRNYIHKQER